MIVINIFKKVEIFFKDITMPSTINSSTKVFKKSYGSKCITDMETGNKEIERVLLSLKPIMISRFGSTELEYLFAYVRGYRNKNVWTNNHREEITKQSGFFPTTDDSLNSFCELYLRCIKNIDVLGVWFKPGEDYFVKKYMHNASLIPLEAIEPYYHSKPWSRYLEGKKVLVIHPFAESIKRQYEKHDLLFSDKNILPKFDLKVYKSIQTLNIHDSKFITWFDALEFMQNEIKNIDFDIAIIGAGAYGLPLASYIKSMGRQSIHMGGATQILFGIKGNRWETRDFFKNLFNEFWVRPLSSEVPKGDLLENACYW